MKLKISQFKFIFPLSLFFIFNFLFLAPVNAQTASAPRFMVSWQANSLAPSWYRGKIFPTTGSRVTVKFELVDNGKIIDLSKTAIRWYVNNDLKLNETNGLGIKSYSYITGDYVGNDINIRISIPNYNGSTLDNVITIPIVSPEVVINAPFSDKTVPPGKVSLEAIPFFFNAGNINNLLFAWNSNGQAAGSTSNPLLNLNIDPATLQGTAISLSVVVKNISNELEAAAKNLQLTTQ